jgi:hypothetical protein
MRRVTIAANTASGTNINASEDTKDVWKWSAIPRTMRDQAATTTKREARRMLKMEYIVTAMVVVSERWQSLRGSCKRYLKAVVEGTRSGAEGS